MICYALNDALEEACMDDLLDIFMGVEEADGTSTANIPDEDWFQSDEQINERVNAADPISGDDVDDVITEAGGIL